MIEIVRFYKDKLEEKRAKIRYIKSLFKIRPDKYQMELMFNEAQTYVTINFGHRRDGATTAALMRAIQIADSNEDQKVLIVSKRHLNTFDVDKLLTEKLRKYLVYRQDKVLYKSSLIHIMTFDEIRNYQGRGLDFNHIIIDGVYYDDMEAVIKEVEPCILYSLGKIEVLLKNRGE